ncbi:MAG: BrnT family toxin [Betaproteobacteria bacterium]|nr:BrnT family toxin [Betaproteobacteria bacterium]
MKIGFDPAKDAENKRKHDGLSLSLAEKMEWNAALVEVDRRFFYEEIRMNAIVPMGNRLYFVAFAERGEEVRIISLRYAERHEVAKYVRDYR